MTCCNDNRILALSVTIARGVIVTFRYIITAMNTEEIKLLNQLAEKIKQRRLYLRLSQESLSDKCGLDRTYISLLERSKRNPSYLTLIKICCGLEMNLIELLGGTNDR